MEGMLGPRRARTGRAGCFSVGPRKGRVLHSRVARRGDGDGEIKRFPRGRRARGCGGGDTRGGGRCQVHARAARSEGRAHARLRLPHAARAQTQGRERARVGGDHRGSGRRTSRRRRVSFPRGGKKRERRRSHTALAWKRRSRDRDATAFGRDGNRNEGGGDEVRGEGGRDVGRNLRRARGGWIGRRFRRRRRRVRLLGRFVFPPRARAGRLRVGGLARRPAPPPEPRGRRLVRPEPRPGEPRDVRRQSDVRARVRGRPRDGGFRPRGRRGRHRPGRVFFAIRRVPELRGRVLVQGRPRTGDGSGPPKPERPAGDGARLPRLVAPTNGERRRRRVARVGRLRFGRFQRTRACWFTARL
mmetsp:Transcript_6192/g.26306  ORF Transcript_6192/g.26306 Transcript_6192/m.26306 type:complete len:358 (-) Transcript_6192:663-1736(-)